MPGEGREDGDLVVYGVERTPFLLQLGTAYYPLGSRNGGPELRLLGPSGRGGGARRHPAAPSRFTGLVPWTSR